MEPQSIIKDDMEEQKDLWQTVIRLGFCSVHLGKLTEKTDDVKAKTFMMKLAGSAPKRAGEQFSVFTLGIKVISYGERLRLGFIRRKQVLKKV